MREMTVVTIALQFFNSESTLAAAVRSIIGQTFGDWELLLQDDGSTDKSLEVAKAFADDRVKVFSDGVNRKRPVRLNTALRQASGKYFALMDADDIAYPERIARQIAFLNNEPEVDLVGAAMLVFNGRGEALGKRVGPETHQEICRRPWAGFPLAQPTFMGRTAWFKQFAYRDGSAPTEDQDLLARSYHLSRFANLADILLGYREVSLSVRKQLLGRRQVTSALVRAYLKQHRPLLAGRAAAVQLAKTTAEMFAVGTGLDYRVLRHRARVITEEERRKWNEVWATATRHANNKESR
jgi:glycosyltransferase involved in cell wall biosynthesis